MNLGEKLRQARLAAGLSQRQLCGQEITRNMLSQIESGKARPSMTTLQYLAARLGKPVSYFLEEADRSPGEAALEDAREAFRQGAFRQGLDLLNASPNPSEEAAFLQYLCLTELGKAATGEGRLPYARQLLEKAGSIETVYKTAPLERERLLLLLAAGGDAQIPTDDRPLLLSAEKALEEKDLPSALRYLDACDSRDSYWALLWGTAQYLSGDYSAALERLKQAEKDFPRQAIPMLEACCKELEDYKQAYYYACLQR